MLLYLLPVLMVQGICLDVIPSISNISALNWGFSPKYMMGSMQTADLVSMVGMARM